jgi:hypothetical protein
VLKKAGIVVATAAAGLLAVSPLAFAGEKGGHHSGGNQSGGTKNVEKTAVKGGDQSEGLINIADNNFNVPIQVCNTDVPILAVDVEDIAGAIGILGDAAASSGDEGGQRTCEVDGGAEDSGINH